MFMAGELLLAEGRDSCGVSVKEWDREHKPLSIVWLVAVATYCGH